jgi:carboxypeptidase C (cathepsin A)
MRLAAAALLALLLAGPPLPSLAQEASPAQSEAAPRRQSEASRSSEDRALLPAAVSRKASIVLGGRTLDYTVEAGSTVLRDGDGKRKAEVFSVGYALDGADAKERPITFAINGGPGAGSAFLHLGVIGPKRLPLEGDDLRPSAPPVLVDNPDTWLDFTDLVFLDPVGTGWSRAAPGVDAAKEFWTVGSDIASIAETIRLYLDAHGRRTSPVYILGESYGGFRGPKIADALQREKGVGVAGLVLLSPVLDFGARGDGQSSPIPWMTRLPSIVAARLEQKGPVTRDMLAEAERYAATDYLVDLVRGPKDAAAIERMADRLSALTGIDRDAVKRVAGRIGMDTIIREARRTTGRVISLYDAGVTGLDPYPNAQRSRYRDPVLDAMLAPLAGAMADYVGRQLGYAVERPYEVLSREVNRRWDFDVGREPPEAVDELRQALAADKKLGVLVAHGLTDLVTPYFESQFVLDQMPAIGNPERVKLAVYPGGHMFYTRPEARSAFRADAKALYARPPTD